MQTILSNFFVYATLSISSTPLIVSDTIGPLEKSEPWKWAVILWLISGNHTLSSGQQRPAVAAAVFLWVQCNSPATQRRYYHCCCSLASGGQITQTGSGELENLHKIKPDWPTHIYTLSLFLSLLSDWKRSTFSPHVPLTMCWGYGHPAAKEKITSPSSCT